MAINLVEAIQRNLGLPALEKIDPNIQEAKTNRIREPKAKLAQAAIPAVLTALYRYSRNDVNAQAILSGNMPANWLSELFEGKESVAIQKVSDYAGVSSDEAGSLMETIADESILAVRHAVPTPATPASVKTLMNDQRHMIIVYLPAALQMGSLLNEETLDDRTNKMEGPVSSFMHKIENKLSASDQPKYP